jgi:tetratricopeptide (TPR) repeat protein
MKQHAVAGMSVFLVCVLAIPPFASAKESSQDSYLQGLVQERFGRPSDAVAFYRRAAELDPNSRFLKETLAELCLRLGRLDEALAAARGLVDLDPKNGSAHVLEGRVRIARGELMEADGDFQRALAINPSDDDALINSAYLRTAADPEGAIPFLKRYVQQHPGSPQASVHIARLYETLRDLKSAESWWRIAAEQDPDNAEPLAALGRIADAQGDRESAASFYRQARLLAPGRVDVLVPLGEVLQRLGRREEAKEALEQALRSDPAHAGAHFGLAMIAEDEGDWPLAARHMAAAAEGSDLVTVRIQLAYDQSMAGQPKKSLKTLLEASRLDPGNADVWMYLGLAYEETKNPRRALKSFLRVLQLDPGRADALFHAGAVLDDALHQFDRAEPLLKKAVELAPTHAPALNYLGYSWADRGLHLDEAVALIKRALAQQPDNPAFLDSLGWALFKQGRAAEAADVLTKAAAAAHDAVVWEHLGDAWNGAGRRDKAARAWQEGLLADPGRKSLKRRLGPAASEGEKPLDPDGLPRAVLRETAENLRGLQGVAGATAFSVRAGPASVEGEGIFYYRRDGNFRLEILGPLGTPAGVIVRTPQGLRMEPEGAGGHALAATGPAWEALAGLLSGEALDRFDGHGTTAARKGSKLVYRSADGILEIAGAARRLVKFASGDLVVLFEGDCGSQDRWWPEVIRVEVGGRKMSAALIFRSPRLDPPLDDDLFQAGHGQ